MTSAIRQIPLDTATHHHSHDFHQIVIGLKGQAEFEIEGPKCVTARAGRRVTPARSN